MTIDEFKKNIAPYMKKGYVAMDQDRKYWWYNRKPRKVKYKWNPRNLIGNDCYCLSELFNIEPVEDWTQSLIEVGK